jgi:hypothetical protein
MKGTPDYRSDGTKKRLMYPEQVTLLPAPGMPGCHENPAVPDTGYRENAGLPKKHIMTDNKIVSGECRTFGRPVPEKR